LAQTARRVAGWVSALLLGSAGGGGAQIARFASRADLVVLSATAVDDHGRPVTNLKREEFRVYEDGRQQKIQHFSFGRESTLKVLFLVDASGSMTGKLKITSARMALRHLLAALGPEDEAALAAFDHKYWGVVAFTRDRAAIEKAFTEIEPFSSTALHDALDRAAADLATHGEGRKAVVVLTDGVDTASQKRPEDVMARSKALDVPIYAMTVLSPLDDPASDHFSPGQNPAPGRQGIEILKRYAALSGGAAFTVSDFPGLQQAASSIVGELKHQYRLGYDPPAGPAHFRRIAVATTRKGVVVKTRNGYVPES
jgi:Ca-activated chloride channel family protein